MTDDGMIWIGFLLFDLSEFLFFCSTEPFSSLRFVLWVVLVSGFCCFLFTYFIGLDAIGVGGGFCGEELLTSRNNAPLPCHCPSLSSPVTTLPRVLIPAYFFLSNFNLISHPTGFDAAG